MGTRLFLTKFERVQRAAQKPPLAAPRTIRGGDICEENDAACQKSPIMIEIGLLRRVYLKTPNVTGSEKFLR